MDRYDIDRCEPCMNMEDAGEYVRYEDVEELLNTVKEYLTFDSCDGRIKYRQPLRDKLKRLTE